jgi:hypothetical protein
MLTVSIAFKGSPGDERDREATQIFSASDAEFLDAGTLIGPSGTLRDAAYAVDPDRIPELVFNLMSSGFTEINIGKDPIENEECRP